MKRQTTGALGRSILLVAAVLAASLVAVGPAQAITNGQPDGNRHPNVGLMVVSFGSGPEPFCTGTLIAPTRFLTAAHCIAILQQLDGETIGVTFDPQTFVATFGNLRGTSWPGYAAATSTSATALRGLCPVNQVVVM